MTEGYTDKVLYKVHQHILVLVFTCIATCIPTLIFLGVIGNFLFDWGIFFQFLFFPIVILFIIGWHYFFWVKSYFLITNEKIVVKVRNGIFSKFHMSIYFKNIRDTAFSKNHIFHYMFDYGTFFARSSAGAIGDLEGKNLPNIEKIYHIVNMLHNMGESERKILTTLPLLGEKTQKGEEKQKNKTEKETVEEAIEKEKNILLAIQGIKEVVVLDGKDRRYIFEHEEEKNHGVFECLRRQALFAVTHDSTLRDPDESIVMKAGTKVIFPVVEFHEIKRKKVSSSSPGIKIHEYLAPKFQNLDDYDATLLIGFDV